MSEQKKVTGKCKFFDRKKGWGFITESDGKEGFIHQTDILMDGFRTLEEGQTVEYELSTCEDGRTKATNVTVIKALDVEQRDPSYVTDISAWMKPVL